MNYQEYRRRLKLEGKPPKEKKKRQIKPVSNRRQVLNREYSKKARPFWKGKPCAIRAPGCWGQAQGVHHKKGKSTPALLLDERHWMPACNHCNLWVEMNHAEAVRLGLKVSRLTLPS